MKINYSFIGLIIFSLYTGYIKELGLLLSCLLLHELGHIIFILLFKIKIKRFTLSLYGGLLELNEFDYQKITKYKQIMIYISGIIMNLLFYVIFKNNIYGKYHLLLFVFNLLPIYPLDGYNVIKLLLFNNNYQSNTIVNNLSVIFIVILLIYSIYSCSIGLLLIVIVLIVKNIQYYKSKDKIYLLNLINNMV